MRKDLKWNAFGHFLDIVRDDVAWRRLRASSILHFFISLSISNENGISSAESSSRFGEEVASHLSPIVSVFIVTSSTKLPAFIRKCERKRLSIFGTVEHAKIRAHPTFQLYFRLILSGTVSHMPRHISTAAHGVGTHLTRSLFRRLHEIDSLLC